MEPSTNLLFKSSMPHQPVATVFLVENSTAMSSVWHDLRDHHLAKVVDTILHNNPSVPKTVSVLESYPCLDPGSNSSPLRQYSANYQGLVDLRFSPAEDNRLSPAAISNAINVLLSGELQSQCPALHLVIVAATTPSSDRSGQYMSSPYHPWTLVAQQMAKNKIHCHLALVLDPRQDMSAFSLLFDETLRLQGGVEAAVPPTFDPSRLSLRFSAPLPLNTEPATPLTVRNNRTGTAQLAQALLMQQPAQATVPRRNSYPLDNLNFYQEAFDQPSPSSPQIPDTEPTPTLVTQLQQVHGLTKKKVYGAKPVRAPFFREREKRTPPALLTMPMPPPQKNPSPTAGGRVPSQARTDRMNRLSQASPTDVYSRRSFSRQPRASRLSTPETDAIAAVPVAPNDISPGSSYVSSDYSSPMTPAGPGDDNYANYTLMDQSPTAIHTAPLSSYQSAGVPDATWGMHPQYPGGYSAQSQSYFPPASRHLTSSEGMHSRQQAQVVQLPGGDAGKVYPGYVTSASTASWQAPNAVASSPSSSGSADSDSTPAPPAPATGARTAKKATTPQEDEDNEQFTFGKEFVAATAVLFNTEVLPAYPDFPGLSSGLVTDLSTLENMTPAQAGELFASRPRHRASVPSFHSNGAPMTSPSAAAAATAGVHGYHQPQHYSQNYHYHHQPVYPMSSGHMLPPSTSSSAYPHQYYDQGGLDRSTLRYPPTHLPGASSLTGWAG